MATDGKKKDEEVVHYVSERKKRGRPKPKMQPQMTPMIDVTFQLLLFFLLTMTFQKSEGHIPAELPADGENSGIVTTPDPLWVYVKASESGPKILIQDEHNYIENWRGLREKLDAKYQVHKNDKIPIYIMPDKDALWAHSINAYLQAQSSFKIVAFSAKLGKGVAGQE